MRLSEGVREKYNFSKACWQILSEYLQTVSSQLLINGFGQRMPHSIPNELYFQFMGFKRGFSIEIDIYVVQCDGVPKSLEKSKLQFLGIA